MKESIYTIPVSEVLEPRDGCPLCRMQDTLEKRAVEYIMGRYDGAGRTAGNQSQRLLFQSL